MPSKNVNVETGTVTFKFDDNAETTLMLDDYSPEMQRHLALHGLSQKAGDSYSGAAKASEEEGVDINDYCKQSVDRVHSSLLGGNFNAGGGGIRGGIFVEALSLALGKEQDEVLEMVKGWSEDKVKEVKKHPQVKEQMLTIRQARAAAASKAAGPLTMEGIEEAAAKAAAKAEAKSATA